MLAVLEALRECRSIRAVSVTENLVVSFTNLCTHSASITNRVELIVTITSLSTIPIFNPVPKNSYIPHLYIIFNCNFYYIGKEGNFNKYDTTQVQNLGTSYDYGIIIYHFF